MNQLSENLPALTDESERKTTSIEDVDEANPADAVSFSLQNEPSLRLERDGPSYNVTLSNRQPEADASSSNSPKLTSTTCNASHPSRTVCAAIFKRKLSCLKLLKTITFGFQKHCYRDMLVEEFLSRLRCSPVKININR